MLLLQQIGEIYLYNKLTYSEIWKDLNCASNSVPHPWDPYQKKTYFGSSMVTTCRTKDRNCWQKLNATAPLQWSWREKKKFGGFNLIHNLTPVPICSRPLTFTQPQKRYFPEMKRKSSHLISKIGKTERGVTIWWYLDERYQTVEFV